MMEETIASGVATKLFAGFLVTSELRMHLNYSVSWKEAEILKQGLKRIPFENREYLGLYLDTSWLPLDALKNLEESLKQSLSLVCPEYKQDKLLIHIFSQSFIG